MDVDEFRPLARLVTLVCRRLKGAFIVCAISFHVMTTHISYPTPTLH